MPSKSKAQQRLFGMALAAKRGKGEMTGKVKELADSMSEKQLHDYASTKSKDLPEKKADFIARVLRIKQAADKLKGGEGDNKPDGLFNRKELAKGEEHEGEHTKDKGIAKEIAKDHLSERKDYYSALAKAKLD
jgi:hypothetical protein